MEDALRRLTERLEREAERLAHALHDDAGPLLTAAHITLAHVARDIPSARERLDEVRRQLDQIEAHLRRLAHEMRPRILDDLGLVPALDFLASGVEQRAGILVRVEGDRDLRLPALVETTLYRLTQEALTNASRHAHASEVAVLVAREPGLLRCTIQDDGVGFDPPAVLGRRGEPSLGLFATRERLEALGGKLEILSAPGRGTTLVVTIPMEG
jgi:signal transduction histidine kinase